MCTNYRPTSRDWLAQQLGGVAPAFDYEAETYPGYAAPVLRRPHKNIRPESADESAPTVECLKACFGLIPFWAKDTKIARMTYNARSETSHDKPAFRQAWSRRQWCLVPMDCFYEPSYERPQADAMRRPPPEGNEQSGKTTLAPESGCAVRWRIHRHDGAPFMVAGLWDRWVAPGTGETVFSFAMLTLNADTHPLMRRFHRPGEEKRSVAVIGASRCEQWLAAEPDAALALLHAPAVDEFTSREEPAPPRRSAARAVPT